MANSYLPIVPSIASEIPNRTAVHGGVINKGFLAHSSSAALFVRCALLFLPTFKGINELANRLFRNR